MTTTMATPTAKELAEQDGEQILWIRFTGLFALPTIPHHRSDPYPYPLIHPEMAKMMVSKVKAKPEIEVEPRVIIVEKPIQYETIAVSGINRFTTDSFDPDPARNLKTLRNITMLVDVSYVVGFTYTVNTVRANTAAGRARPYRKTVKHYMDEARRKMKRGEEHEPPYFGQAKCPAAWEYVEEPPEQGYPINMTVGRLPLVRIPIDISRDVYENLYFDAVITNGVLHTPASLWEPHRQRIYEGRHRFQQFLDRQRGR